MNVIVVEDDPVTRLLLCDTLSLWGYTVLEASSGAEALDLTNQYPEVQLVLADWSMPELNGIELCRRLKENNDRFMYFIMLTSKSGTDKIVEAMDAGADDFISKPFSHHELRVRVKAGAKIVEQEKRLQFYANYDALTKIWNRRMILEFLHNEFTRYQREQGVFSILLLDIDLFKKVNDTHGHLMGDKVLEFFCNIVSQQIRPYDVFGRYGGEEFLLIMPQTNPEDCLLIAERIRMAVAKTNWTLELGVAFTVTVSIGAVSVDASDNNADDLFRRADEALYTAKQQGRNKVVLWTPP